MVGPVSDWLVPRGGNTLFGVSVAEAASLHDHVIDGKVTAGQRFMCRGGVFGLARTRLVFQQSDSDVGHPELLLTFLPEGIEGLPLWEGAVDHLLVREQGHFLVLFVSRAVQEISFGLLKQFFL